MNSNKNEEGINRRRGGTYSRQQELIFNNSADITFLIAVEENGRYRFITVNNAFLNASHLTREQVEGKYAEEVIPVTLYPAILEKFNRAIEVQQTIQWEDTSDYPDGRKTGIITVSPVFNEQRICTMLVGTIHDITERKKAEEILRSREKQLELIYNTVSDVIFLISIEPGPRYRFTSVNNTFLVTTGLKKEEVEGKYAEKIIPAASLSYALSKYGEAVQYRKMVQWEETSDYPAGRKTGVVSITPVFNENSECSMLVGTVHDITDRNKVLEEKNRISYMLNERVKELTTLYRADQILQSEIKPVETVLQELVSILPPGWQYPEITEAGIFLGDQLYATTGFGSRIYNQSASFQTPDGKTGSINLAYTEERPTESEGPFLAEERNLINMLAEKLRVYFARKGATEQLIKEKELSDRIIETLPGLFYIIDETGKYLRWNRLKEIISGYSHAEMTRINSLDFFEGEDKEKVRKAIATGFSTGHTEVEAHVINKDKKEMLFYFNGIVIDYQGKPCLMGMGVDITEKKSLEQEILNRNVQEQKKITRAVLKAQEKERNKIGMELHDNVNQILAGAKMYLGLTGNRKNGVSELVEQSSGLIDNAINEIRSLTQEQVTPRLLVDLKTLVQLLVDKFNRQNKFKTTFECNTDITGISDDLKLNIYRIIQEGTNNIIKHAEAGNVSILIEKIDTDIHIVLKDDGKGFNIQTNGTGIGMSNIRNRVESFNGRVSFHSGPGKGCILDAYIPFLSN